MYLPLTPPPQRATPRRGEREAEVIVFGHHACHFGVALLAAAEAARTDHRLARVVLADPTGAPLPALPSLHGVRLESVPAREVVAARANVARGGAVAPAVAAQLARRLGGPQAPASIVVLDAGTLDPEAVHQLFAALAQPGSDHACLVVALPPHGTDPLDGEDPGVALLRAVRAEHDAAALYLAPDLPLAHAEGAAGLLRAAAALLAALLAPPALPPSLADLATVPGTLRALASAAAWGLAQRAEPVTVVEPRQHPFRFGSEALDRTRAPRPDEVATALAEPARRAIAALYGDHDRDGAALAPGSATAAAEPAHAALVALGLPLAPNDPRWEAAARPVEDWLRQRHPAAHAVWRPAPLARRGGGQAGVTASLLYPVLPPLLAAKSAAAVFEPPAATSHDQFTAPALAGGQHWYGFTTSVPVASNGAAAGR